ncbi:MAG: nucleotidyltransferase domain-containing protein [Candidatus Omnitrophica bacterium]|nr:nucleotidyltransferase domain-containing protein [Candidatus Omnitrophota bacterium]
MYKAEYKVKEIVEEYKETLQKLGIKVDRIILYGSFAKRNQREDSDIDLVIIAEDFQKMNLRERQEVLGIAAARIMKPIEARGYTPDELKMASQASFLKEILEVGVSV